MSDKVKDFACACGHSGQPLFDGHLFRCRSCGVPCGETSSTIESLLAEREREVREACAKVAEKRFAEYEVIAQAIRDSGK